ncbi:hypothetical protein HDU84_000637 [Entophlyctis sp. JEL0112]|nr:hypothetical protein HDU84_000637 [Entophlyctis sp. JEL0112]
MRETLTEAANERFALFESRTKALNVKNEEVPDQFDVEVGEQSLMKLSLFRGVDQWVIHELAIAMIRKTWEKGEVIIQSGDIGNSMFFLAAGEADVITEFGEIIDHVQGPSAYFGEVAMMEHVPRTATIRCSTGCSTYELRKNDVRSVMEKYPDIDTHIKETAHYRMQKYSNVTQFPICEILKEWGLYLDVYGLHDSQSLVGSIVEIKYLSDVALKGVKIRGDTQFFQNVFNET